MSRPFSYNDDNFTVTGNILFCHIAISKDIPSGDNIVEIPPAIVDRLMYNSSLFTRVTTRNNLTAANIIVSVKNNNGIYYLYSSLNITASNTNYIVGYYLLKDI